MQDPSEMTAVVAQLLYVLPVLVVLWMLLSSRRSMAPFRVRRLSNALDELEDTLRQGQPTQARYVARQLGVVLALLLAGGIVCLRLASRNGLSDEAIVTTFHALFDDGVGVNGPR